MGDRYFRTKTRNLVAIISIITGVLILFNPTILALIVAIYLIVRGILDLIAEN